MNENDRLKHSIYNLYAKPHVPEKSKKSENEFDQSVMNLYLKNEK
jgi:hypothetical protein